MKKVWDAFTIAIQNNDFKTLKGLSTNCLYCPECTNDAADNEYACTPFDHFINQGEYTRFYWKGSYVKSMDEKDSVDYFVTFIEKELHEKYSRQLDVLIGDDCRGEECSETIAHFVLTNEGYRFCGYELIP